MKQITTNLTFKGITISKYPINSLAEAVSREVVDDIRAKAAINDCVVLSTKKILSNPIKNENDLEAIYKSGGLVVIENPYYIDMMDDARFYALHYGYERLQDVFNASKKKPPIDELRIFTFTEDDIGKLNNSYITFLKTYERIHNKVVETAMKLILKPIISKFSKDPLVYDTAISLLRQEDDKLHFEKFLRKQKIQVED